jgi:hypothetical protein
MAHALKLDVLHGEEFDAKFSYYLHRWLKIGEKEFISMNKGRASFLHEYGGSNEHEFFAVCVEHFFEAPQEFKEKLPDIFNHLCVLLNLNPLNVNEDYLLTDEYKKTENSKKHLIPLPKVIRRTYLYHKSHWIQTFIKLSFVLSAIIIASNIAYTLISFSELFLIGLCGTIIFAAIQSRYLIKRKILDSVDLFFYLLVGITPMTMALFLMLNTFNAQSYQTEIFPVKNTFYFENKLYVKIDDFKYENLDNVIEISRLNYSGAPVWFIINSKKGLFGINQLVNRGIVYSKKEEYHLYFD